MKNLVIRTSQLGVAGILLSTGLAPWAAQAQSSNDIPALIERINELEQKVKILERNREVDQEAAQSAAQTKARTTPTVALGDNGLVVRSGDSNFSMNIHGYAQTDYRAYIGYKTLNDTFLLRRVRPIIEGTVYKMFDYRLMADFGSGVTSTGTNNNGFIDDAYVNARLLPDLQIQAGKYKAPFGLERLQSTANLPFIETGFPTQFTPNYDTGIIVHNGLFNKPVNYQVGIFNGVADAASGDMETLDEGKEVVGRVFTQPFIKTDIAPLNGLGFGVAGTSGYRTGSTASYKTPGQQTLFAYAAGASYNGEQYRIDPQGYYYWGPFGVLGEYVINSQSIRNAAGVTQRFDNRAWQVIGSWYLTGEQNAFRPVAPLDPIGLNGGGWGAFELVGRFGQLKYDDRIFSLGYATAASAQRADSWGVGLNWHLNKNVELMTDYEQTTFHGGSTAAGSATAKPEHAILTRAQVSF